MMWLALILLNQSSGDTLRWYDPTTVGYDHVGLTNGGYLHWAIILSIEAEYDGITVHSGRVHIWEPMDSTGIMRLCMGDYAHPVSVLDSGSFHSTGYGFYEVLFGDSIVLHEGDIIWLWCSQFQYAGQLPVTTDGGPCMFGFGDLMSFDSGITWEPICTSFLNVNWVMELILTPQEVEEGPSPGPPEKLSLQMAPEGFLISSYEGPVQVYDATGRLLLSQDVKGKTLISPLNPGVYFVKAGRQKGRIAVLR